MTLQSSGPISLQDISIETGNPSNYSASLSWVKSVTKPTAAICSNYYTGCIDISQ